MSRLISERICNNHRFNALNHGAKLCYLLLYLWTDVAGNVPADILFVRRNCFPQQKTMKTTYIQAWLDDIVRVGLASYFLASDGRRYVHFEKFEQFQKNLKGAPKYPTGGKKLPPPDDGRDALLCAKKARREPLFVPKKHEETVSSCQKSTKSASHIELTDAESVDYAPNKSIKIEEEGEGRHTADSQQTNHGGAAPEPPFRVLEFNGNLVGDDEVEYDAEVVRRAIHWAHYGDPKAFWASFITTLKGLRRFIGKIVAQVPPTYEIPVEIPHPTFDPNCVVCRGEGEDPKRLTKVCACATYAYHDGRPATQWDNILATDKKYGTGDVAFYGGSLDAFEKKLLSQKST